jgi:hypothetical protein
MAARAERRTPAHRRPSTPRQRQRTPRRRASRRARTTTHRYRVDHVARLRDSKLTQPRHSRSDARTAPRWYRYHIAIKAAPRCTFHRVAAAIRTAGVRYASSESRRALGAPRRLIRWERRPGPALDVHAVEADVLVEVCGWNPWRPLDGVDAGLVPVDGEGLRPPRTAAPGPPHRGERRCHRCPGGGNAESRSRESHPTGGILQRARGRLPGPISRSRRRGSSRAP